MQQELSDTDDEASMSFVEVPSRVSFFQCTGLMLVLTNSCSLDRTAVNASCNFCSG